MISFSLDLFPFTSRMGSFLEDLGRKKKNDHSVQHQWRSWGLLVPLQGSSRIEGSSQSASHFSSIAYWSPKSAFAVATICLRAAPPPLSSITGNSQRNPLWFMRGPLHEAPPVSVRSLVFAPQSEGQKKKGPIYTPSLSVWSISPHNN